MWIPLCEFTLTWVRKFNLQAAVALCSAGWVQGWRPAHTGIYLGWTALPEPAPHFRGENKTKHKKRGNLTPSLADFPNNVCAHGNKQGRAEIWASFHVIPVELLEERQSFLCRTWWQQRLWSFCFHSIFFRNWKKKKSQWNLTSSPVSKAFPCIIYCPILSWSNKAAHTDADWGLLSCILLVGSGAMLP